MKLMPAHQKKLGDDNLIPMINIVFLLLIFFMIAGQIQNSLPEGMSLPLQDTGSAVDRGQLELSLYADGSLSLHNKAVALSELAQELGELENPQLVLMADKSVTADVLEGVLRALQQQGVSNLTLMTEREMPAS